MTPKEQIKRAAPSPFLITLVLACFAFLPQMQADLCPPEIPSPNGTDGAYPNFATTEGFNPLGWTAVPCTGLGNTAVGWESLYASSANFWNTGVGAGTLAINSADENTATGAGAMLLNIFGFNNTANGAFALWQNQVAFGNTAIGDRALFNNDSDAAGSANANTAVGDHALC
jgi:hypothetical protein